ncbi:unnamed protein product [Adineta ricciae]|uniref:Exonuclease domain-containing protein n=1 Tax=Adineta ricciae TaxID=249248 RepID=A0A814QIM1_ADIRI|nr:unnamed protein product [Adineta ricciae]CAF1119920.1 unnamed protein product [Adineta ricciae]
MSVYLDERQINQMSHNELREDLIKRNLTPNGDARILRRRLIHNCKPREKQLYQFLAVIDFEATCVARPLDPYIQEIIEFPIVLIDVSQQSIIDTFHSYCRPVLQPILSDYCKQLTGITQEQVNHAPTFTEVFANVEKWLNERNLILDSKEICLFITDGPADFNKYLRKQCEISQIKYPTWASQWLNVKQTFRNFYFVTPGRIKNMLDSLQLQFDGNLHSGLDDAKNIAKIVIQLIQDGCVLIPNESYTSSMIPSGRFASIRNDPTRIRCLNCSRSHFNGRSCIKDTSRRRQRSKYHRSLSRETIPSLLEFSFPSASRRLTKH